MKKAVMYGAGNIGRGFIGQLFAAAGYHTVFIDIDSAVVRVLNERHSYPLRLLHESTYTDVCVQNVSAVDGRDTERVREAISEADILATAVGASTLPIIAPAIAAGLARRCERGKTPLDILICENLMDAAAILRGLIRNHLPKAAAGWFEQSVGLVETSIGRMVPLQTPELQDGDPMRICAEAYSVLPVDKDAFKSAIPQLEGIEPFSPFSFHIERKLYIHNMGHFLAACCGDSLGHTYIWQAIETKGVSRLVRNAMRSTAAALAKLYLAEAEEAKLYAHVDDLLRRFANRRLGDTVYRVRRDIRRKLSPGDRMVGALRLCMKAGVDASHIMQGIALALRFADAEAGLTPRQALREICEMQEDEPVFAEIMHIGERGVML